MAWLTNLEHEVKSGALYAVIVIVLGLMAFAFGKYGQPTETITKTETKAEVSHIDKKASVVATSTNQDVVIVHHDDTITTTTMVVASNGTKTQSTTVAVNHDITQETKVDKSATTTHTDETSSDKKTEKDSEKIVKNNTKPAWFFGLDAGLSSSNHYWIPPAAITGNPALSNVPLTVGVRVDRRILGPCFAGIWVHTDKSEGLSFGCEL